MYIPTYDDITLDNFCNIFKTQFKWTYSEIAKEFTCNERTLQRWRKNNNYVTLDSCQYCTLFSALEKGCCQYFVDPKTVLNEFFHLPTTYQKGDYEAVKNLIIYNLNVKLNNTVKKSSLDVKPPAIVHVSPVEFLDDCLQNGKRIKSIYLSFHSGWDWLRASEKRQLLEKFNTMGISLYVVSNPKETIGDIAETMSYKKMQKYYIGFNQGIKQWSICAEELKNLRVRVTNYPIMRKLICVNYYDGTFELVARNYIYNLHLTLEEERYFHLNEGDEDALSFHDEFEYLWQHGKTYETWHKAIMNDDDEELSPGEYILLYTKLKNDDLPYHKRFIICKLNIKHDNKVSLNVNIATSLQYPLTLQEPEYSYQGHIHVTKKNIYFSMFDDAKSEKVTLAVVRPLHNFKRYIGIMTALTTSAHPVAYKCVCLKEDVLYKLNLEKLQSLLQCNNQVWSPHLMIVEENEYNDFYSNAIFKY